MATRGARGFGQYSGTARALERVGDRWALLIVRDLLVGPRRYGDLKAGLPRIPTNILSDRLKELQESGVVRRVPTVRGGYELTALGLELEPVITALERWGWSTLGEPVEGDVVTRDALTIALRSAFRADAAALLPAARYLLHVDDVSVAALVVGVELDVVHVGADALAQPRRGPGPEVQIEVEVALAATVFRDLISGVLAPRHAVASRAVGLVVGDADGLEAFAQTFHIDPAAPWDSSLTASAA